jgi:hypothetical protein
MVHILGQNKPPEGRTPNPQEVIQRVMLDVVLLANMVAGNIKTTEGRKAAVKRAKQIVAQVHAGNMKVAPPPPPPAADKVPPRRMWAWLWRLWYRGNAP